MGCSTLKCFVRTISACQLSIAYPPRLICLDNCVTKKKHLAGFRGIILLDITVVPFHHMLVILAAAEPYHTNVSSI